MGGCRCMFRDCSNSSTRCKGMHFFHYPAKDQERLEMWILMANKPHFRDFPLPKLKNQNVCEEHFKINQFMNIKKERLTRFAIPTLLKLKTGVIVDLEANNVYTHDWSVKSEIPGDLDVVLYEEPNVVHVPPPPPIRLNTTETTPSIVHNFQLKIPEKVEDTEIQIEEAEDNLKYDFVPSEKNDATESTLTTENYKLVAVDNVLQPDQMVVARMKRQISALDIQKADIQYLYPVPMKKIKTEPKIINVEQPKLPVKSLTTTAVQVTLKTAEEEKLLVNEAHLKKRYEEEIKKLNISHQLEANRYMQQIKQLQGEVDRLKTQLSKRHATHETSAQTDPLPTPKTIVVSPKKPTETGKQSAPSTPLSKPQLFNSVKRYLSSTMTTLLKMEIFGGGDRDWKPDEKKLSCEIMNLGENIYTYFVDEWRLRLPPRSKVDKWLNECVEEEEDL